MTGGTDLLAGLNPAQREAAEHVAGPILVIAGAGSGKTRVLTARIAHLIDAHGVPPERIFAVTFTNKAAGEMKHRIGQLLSRDPGGLWIGTFHSLSARLLRREADRIGFSRQFTIYDEDDRLSLIRRLMDERTHSTKLYPPKLIQNIVSTAKNRMQTPAELEASGSYDPAIRVAADVYGAMQRALLSANAMDFDDLMLHPLALFRGHPDVLERWRRRFDFLLVDEFQDTNRAQYELIKLLGGGHNNVFGVGDEDQSIYGWRGADLRNFRDLQRDFGEARLVKLEENYRSTRPILDARQRRHRQQRRPHRQDPAHASPRRRVDRVLARRRRTGRGRMDCPRTGAALQRRGDARECADPLSHQRPVAALEESLRRAGVPYQFVGAISFYDRREVKDILAYLRLIANASDDEAFLRAISVPRRGIGDVAVAAWRSRRANGTFRCWRRPNVPRRLPRSGRISSSPSRASPT